MAWPGNSGGLPGASDTSGYCLRVKSIDKTGFFSKHVQLFIRGQRVSGWLAVARVGGGQGIQQKEAGAGDDCAVTGCPVTSKY